MNKFTILSDYVGAGAGNFKTGFRSVVGEGNVLKKFESKTEALLPKELKDFIYSQRKSNKLKPLDKDTVYLNAYKSPQGDVLLDVDVLQNKFGGYGETLSKQDGTLSVEKLKETIAKLKNIRAKENAKGILD